MVGSFRLNELGSFFFSLSLSLLHATLEFTFDKATRLIGWGPGLGSRKKREESIMFTGSYFPKDRYRPSLHISSPSGRFSFLRSCLGKNQKSCFSSSFFWLDFYLYIYYTRPQYSILTALYPWLSSYNSLSFFLVFSRVPINKLQDPALPVSSMFFFFSSYYFPIIFLRFYNFK